MIVIVLEEPHRIALTEVNIHPRRFYLAPVCSERYTELVTLIRRSSGTSYRRRHQARRDTVKIMFLMLSIRDQDARKPTQH